MLVRLLEVHYLLTHSFIQLKLHKTKMSKWFRSEPMEYISLIVNEDAAHDCLADLGKLGVLQFTDVSDSTAVELLVSLG